MKEQTIAKAGSLICIDQGEYSDYTVIGFFVVLKDFELAAQLAEYLADNPAEKMESWRYGFQPDSFLHHLLAQGLLLEVDYGNLFLGCCGNIGEVRFTL